ncbi:hypothetical protein E2P86_17740 [Sphingobacterium psychroaquaticum]|uniref:nuclear transport factor 2 family protein n=1 Tax=Sphingobacterium psychroaquaticum TaxID=561061 RepID=UPI00106A1E95|nr:nuclear transport factor 2 family protein [Sphingobacterium psychroaquaticum]QBQ42879.1 hypothetical protein E2P86_17740 [Sphingobacterium psychroaquaticum]
MKRTVTTIAAAFIMIASFSSFAAEKANPLRNLDSKNIVLSYLEATTAGNVVWNKHLFAEDFTYSNVANGDNFSKKQYRAFLKATKGLKYDCTTTYEILDEAGQTCMAKATMKFDNFTRVDYITLSKSQEGWQVSKVLTTYP